MNVAIYPPVMHVSFTVRCCQVIDLSSSGPAVQGVELPKMAVPMMDVHAGSNSQLQQQSQHIGLRNNSSFAPDVLKPAGG